MFATEEIKSKKIYATLTSWNIIPTMATAISKFGTTLPSFLSYLVSMEGMNTVTMIRSRSISGRNYWLMISYVDQMTGYVLNFANPAELAILCSNKQNKNQLLD